MPKETLPRPHAEVAPSDGQLLERFAANQDPGAFALLIERHGPMVLGVCRRVLNHEQEAEDAFQATFLVLVRRAGSLERPELLGNWLYGVAYRTAHKARARLARRRHHERRVQPMPPVEPDDPLVWQELRGVLDTELRELPSKYRVPLVLCYLEGMTNEEAAHRLGWPTGSMSYRLARGRQLLRDRLRQRQQRLPGMFLIALLKRHAGPEQVPPDLAEATLRRALGQDDRRLPPVLPPIVPTDVGEGTASRGAASPGMPQRRWGRLLLLAGLLAAGLTAVGAVAASGGYDRLARAIGMDEQQEMPVISPVDGMTGSGMSCH